MKKFLLASAIGTMLTAGVAVATQTQTAPAPRAPLTKADALARADARFDRLDTNKDGQLSAEERRAGMEAARKAMAERRGARAEGAAPGRRGGPAGAATGGRMGERMLDRIDTNKDGLISKAENRAAAEARFDRMDANRNGVIDRDEMRRPGMGRHGGKQMGHRGPGAGVMRADADKDGVVTRAEYDAMSAKRFEALDANKDGRIDAAELKAQRDQARERFKAHREKARERRGNAPSSPAAPQGE